jgi:DNA repair protein RadC
MSFLTNPKKLLSSKEIISLPMELIMNDLLSQSELEIVNSAIEMLESKFKRESLIATSPELAKKYCRLKLGGLGKEVFAVLFLDSQHQLIQYSELFHGTINQATVYPREVVKTALACGAACVIVAHNHPSGKTAPSDADRNITNKVRRALDLMDIDLKDHIIVSATEEYSFAENGLL